MGQIIFLSPKKSKETWPKIKIIRLEKLLKKRINNIKHTFYNNHAIINRSTANYILSEIIIIKYQLFTGDIPVIIISQNLIFTKKKRLSDTRI